MFIEICIDSIPTERNPDASPNLALTITQRSRKHFIHRCLFDIRVGTAVLSPTHCAGNPVNCYCSAIKLSCLYVLPSLYFILYEILYDWVIINVHIGICA